MDTKPFYLSKTFWVQVLALVAVVVPKTHDFIMANLGESASIWAVINVVLRLFSKDKLSIS